MSSDQIKPQEKGGEEITQQEFQNKITEAGGLAQSGDVDTALARFEELFDIAQTPAQEGQAKLNLGVWRLTSDRVAAVELLKEVSLNESYTVPVRAKAMNYVLNEYTATKDELFARQQIFTGPVWETFYTEGMSLSEAALRGFEYSVDLFPTPEATMRVATQYSQLLRYESSSTEEMEEYAQNVLENIKQGDEAISRLIAEDRVQYGETDFTEIAVAYNRKGIALDVLYFRGYIDDPNQVENAFQDALNLLIENRGGEGTELFVRYHYADFLLRLDAEGRNDAIKKILTPMTQMSPSHNAAKFFRNRIADKEQNERRDELDPARPDNIIRLAQISPEFRKALIDVGVSENKLAF